jgi:hypothetical protein
LSGSKQDPIEEAGDFTAKHGFSIQPRQYFGVNGSWMLGSCKQAFILLQLGKNLHNSGQI